MAQAHPQSPSAEADVESDRMAERDGNNRHMLLAILALVRVVERARDKRTLTRDRGRVHQAATTGSRPSSRRILER